MKIPVLIAGAGPVGLSLALDLAWRGVPSLVVEPLTEVHPHPRAISIGVRTMEHFRRLGLDQKVIDAGVPRSRALDVIYVTRMLGREIFRFPDPVDRRVGARCRGAGGANAGDRGLALLQDLDRAIAAGAHAACRGRALAADRNALWLAAQFIRRRVTQGVTATLVEFASGRREEVAAQYLIGSDGANSAVRAGNRYRAWRDAARSVEAVGFYFKAPALGTRLGARPGVMYWGLAPGCGGVIYTIEVATNGSSTAISRRARREREDPIPLIQRALGEPLGSKYCRPRNGCHATRRRSLSKCALLLAGDAATSSCRRAASA